MSTEEALSENYQKEEITIDASKANLKALYLMLPIAIMTATPYYIIWKHSFTIGSVKAFLQNHKDGISGTLTALTVIVMGIIVHELIHGVMWSVFAKRGLRSIRFGMLWKELTPYCHCQEPLPVRQYLIGALMPAVVLGVIPSVVAYISGSLILLLFGIFFTMAAAGDFMIINLIRREHPNDLVLDHPAKIGCFIYRKIKP